MSTEKQHKPHTSTVISKKNANFLVVLRILGVLTVTENKKQAKENIPIFFPETTGLSPSGCFYMVSESSTSTHNSLSMHEIKLI